MALAVEPHVVDPYYLESVSLREAADAVTGVIAEIYICGFMWSPPPNRTHPAWAFDASSELGLQWLQRARTRLMERADKALCGAGTPPSPTPGSTR